MGRLDRWSWRPGSDGSEEERRPGPSVRRRDGKWRAVALWGTMSAALLLKLALHLGGAVVFDSDEAIVGLMARHILHGARPVFFYGQAYMGSLDAWLVASAFALFGPSVGAIRAVQGVLFLAHVGLTYLLTRRWSGDEAVASLSALLMAWPPLLLTLYTSVSLGGYVETLVLGDLLLILGWKLATGRKPSLGWWAVLGALAGLGFWTLALIAVYLVPLGVLELWRHRGRAWRGYLLAAVTFVVGSGPWWAYNLGHGWQGVSALCALAGREDPLAPVLPVQVRVLGLLAIGLPGLIGTRLPWSAEWLSLLVAPPLAAFYAATGLHAWGQARRNAWGGAYRLLWGLVLSFVAMFVLSRFGSDPTGRYFAPLYTPWAIFVAAALVALGRKVRWAAAVLTALLLAFHLWGTWRGASSAEGLTAQYNPQLQYGNEYDEELIAFLRANGGTRGYTHYWIAFKIAFLSDEQVILAPCLPHKASGHVIEADRRYPPYADRVSRAQDVVYVTGNQLALDSALREGFAERGVAYREQAIGPYRVFYGLSLPVSPSELDPRWQ